MTTQEFVDRLRPIAEDLRIHTNDGSQLQLAFIVVAALMGCFEGGDYTPEDRGKALMLLAFHAGMICNALTEP